VAAFLLNAHRPAIETEQPTAQLVEATGKCAQCHREQTGAVVHEYELSRHAKVGVNCLDCHGPAEGQTPVDHNGFRIAKALTAKNCARCHSTQYEQYARSRHAAPAWAAIHGKEGFSESQLQAALLHHPEAIERPPNSLVGLEGASAVAAGCESCHSVGKPNDDGSFGTCTACHARHVSSVELARLPETCGQCHMGPDHSQIEIYDESKHGVLFAAQHERFHLAVSPDRLTTADMPVPTCATCHMSGLNGLATTHDTTERLSWYLFASVSDRRPTYAQGQVQMKQVCTQCHARTNIDRFYQGAEKVVASTNEKVRHMNEVMAGLRRDGLLTPEPMDEPIEFMAFDFWHYYGRTAKHGAFMGGADFVQWHGNYELLKIQSEIDAEAQALRRRAEESHAEAPKPPAAAPPASRKPATDPARAPRAADAT
jgi:hydroxylamine dehydrogenase